MYYEGTLVPDCSAALSDNTSFSALNTINFQSGGTDVQLTSSYEDVFTHNIAKTICSLNQCTLMVSQTSCTVISTSTNIIMGPNPYVISIKNSIPAGYSETFCLVCEIQTVGYSTVTTFQRNEIRVT